MLFPVRFWEKAYWPREGVTVQSFYIRTFLHLVMLCYVFQITLTSSEGLTKYISTRQLTPEYFGTLNYDHITWFRMRTVRSFVFTFDTFM